MQTRIHADLENNADIREADKILRSCVHCGFCTATCPTYQLLGDELDGPRGRIYLIKNLLEENWIAPEANAHLDRCLTCRACETTCPSGVRYGRLLDIARDVASQHVSRPAGQRLMVFLLRLVIPRRALLLPLYNLGRVFRPLLPNLLAKNFPRRRRHEISNTAIEQARASAGKKPEGNRILLLQGCVQRAATPGVNEALRILLETTGASVCVEASEGCCGALDYHLAAHVTARSRMRALLDLLAPRLDNIDYIVSSASGCGVTLKEYPAALSGDPEYIAKAELVAAKVVDVAELLSTFSFSCREINAAVHTPCTLQHGQKIDGTIESILISAGIRIVATRDRHLCCGSAGTYSILQPTISKRLLAGKLDALQENNPEVIVTANVGCQLQLDSGASVPVMHWVELLARQLR